MHKLWQNLLEPRLLNEAHRIVAGDDPKATLGSLYDALQIVGRINRFMQFAAW